MRISLRAKMVLVALVLAVIPLVGYLHVKQMERLLREGQEQALLATARAIATALHDRPQLLDLRAGEPASGEMQLILKSLARADSRIWIVDQRQRLLALAGDLKRTAPLEESGGPLDFAIRLVRPVTSYILEPPSNEFDDALPESEIVAGPVATSALQGVAAHRWRQTPDSRAVILSASYPVWDGERVVAAVVAEETTNRIRSVYNRAMEQVVAVTLIAFLAGGLVLLAFASRLSTRLLHLRDEAEAAIDSQGRVRKLIAGSAAGDEIGDLSRSFSTVLERLAQYNRYLESMAGRLSHELRTPIAVVRSSLENLRLQPLPEDAAVYLERANDGLRRLDTLLTRMSEATRLEHAVRETTRERFDVRDVVRGCAYAYPQKKIEIDVPESPVAVRGAPDLYAQMLDKLISNAVDFSVGDEAIRVRLQAREGEAVLTVSNRGPRLPEAMAGKLFESMVSVRASHSAGEPHLGLGLYIVRLVAEFHGGVAQAMDREDGSGVLVRVRCPLNPGPLPQ
ncbi:MAG TPA: ATP-binding protein [Burkholderiales bacterium]|nr:ATP-binding protein [Burkholderiales bacterium]